ncbi:MAG: hypothetical protein ACYDCQ_21920 [Dehalococcoidia bacterium]
MTIARVAVTGKQTKSAIAAIGTPLTLLGAAGLILAAMLLPVVQSSDATTTGYTIRRHEQELSDINAHVYQLQAEVAQLGSMGRIASEATRLGMLPGGQSAVPVTVNYAPPAKVVLPRRFVPDDIPSPAPTSHTVIWSLLHPLSPR